jgi:hypothetical protein
MGTSPRQRKRFLSFLLVGVFSCGATLALLSCSKKPSEAIIGKWQLQGQQDTFEFRLDGTVITLHQITAGPPENPRIINEATTEKYAFTDAGHLNLQIKTGDTNQPTITASCEVLIHGDTMDMTITAPGAGHQHQLNFRRLE